MNIIVVTLKMKFKILSYTVWGRSFTLGFYFFVTFDIKLFRLGRLGKFCEKSYYKNVTGTSLIKIINFILIFCFSGRLYIEIVTDVELVVKFSILTPTFDIIFGPVCKFLLSVPTSLIKAVNLLYHFFPCLKFHVHSWIKMLTNFVKLMLLKSFEKKI